MRNLILKAFVVYEIKKYELLKKLEERFDKFDSKR